MLDWMKQKAVILNQHEYFIAQWAVSWLPVEFYCDTQLQIYVDKSNGRLNHDCCAVLAIM